MDYDVVRFGSEADTLEQKTAASALPLKETSLSVTVHVLEVLKAEIRSPSKGHRKPRASAHDGSVICG